MQHLLKTRPFARLARKYGITDVTLKQVVEEMKNGLYEANLGGNLFKKRIAVGGRGKSGGSRHIIATNLQDRWFFLHCYLKKDVENISQKDEDDFKAFARLVLNLTDKDIEKAIRDGILEEI